MTVHGNRLHVQILSIHSSRDGNTQKCARKSSDPDKSAHTLFLQHSLSRRFTFPVTCVGISLACRQQSSLTVCLRCLSSVRNLITRLPSGAGGRTLFLPLHLPSLAATQPIFLFFHSASLLCQMLPHLHALDSLLTLDLCSVSDQRS